MRLSSNALLVSASGLLFSAAALVLYLQGPHCKRIGGSKATQLIGYIRARYGIPANVEVTLEEDHLLNDSCTREVTLASPAWHGQRSFFLSADQNYLLSSALDLRTKPQLISNRPQAAETLPLPFSPLAQAPAPLLGDKGAQATLVEFSDFECPYCSRFAHVVGSDLDPSDRKKLRIQFHFFPLPFHPWAEKAAEEAYCVSQQSQPAFWDLHDYLFAHQRAISESNLDAQISAFIATHTSLNRIAFNSCTGSGKARDAVAADIALGKKYGVSGTPTSFLNGQRIVGARTAVDLHKTIESAISHPSETVQASAS